MPKRKAIATIVSDTHCMPNAWAGRPGLAGDAFYALRSAVDFTIGAGLPLLLAGDIIDVQTPPPSTIWFLRRQMSRMEKAKLPVFYVLGNHEVTDPPWLKAVHDWPECLHDKTRTIGGVSFFGLNFTTFDKLGEALQKISPHTDVLLCHQAWQEFMGTMCRTDGSLAMIPHVKLTITGDFHGDRTLQTTNAQGQPMTVLSPGSLVQTEISETEPRRLHVLYDDLTTHAHDLVGRKQLEPPTLHTEEDLDAFLKEVDEQIKQAEAWAAKEGLPTELHKPILRVTYDTRIPNVFRRLQQAIGEQAHFFRRELPREVAPKEKAKKKKRDASQLGLIGCLSEVVPDVESRLYKSTRSLLEAVQRGEKPELAIQKLREEFLHGSDLPDE